MRFSIITPSFKQLDWLRLAIASVRDQAGEGGVSVEHIVQDAGSPGIEELARERGAAFFREGRQMCEAASPTPGYSLTIYSKRDAGMYDAVNRGFRRASGEVFAYLNCDEQYLPGVLKRIAEEFDASPGCETLFADAIVTDSKGAYLCDRRVTIPTAAHVLVSGNLSIFTAATFSRAEVFQKRNLFFDPSYKNVGDAEWVLRLIKSGVSLRTLRLRAAVFADTGENLNMQPEGAAERARLRGMAAWPVRAAAPLVVAHHRLKRLLGGAYALAPHGYEIFTRNSPGERVRFEAARPTFRWPGR